MNAFKAFFMREFTETLQPWLRSLSYGGLGIAIAVTVFVFWLRYIENNAPVVVGQTVVAQKAKEVVGVPKVDAQMKAPPKVYKGGAALKNGLKLPASIVSNEAEQVIASSKVRADDHPHTLTTTINTETGESETYDRVDPLPWVAWDTRGSVGIYAGIKNGQTAIRLEARQDVFDVKSIRCGGIASVDQMSNGPISADYFIGAGCAYHW